MDGVRIKIGDSNYLGQDCFGGYTLTTDINRACVFKNADKANNFMKAKPKVAKGKSYQICEASESHIGGDNSKSYEYLPVDFNETTELLNSLEGKLYALNNNVDYWNGELSRVDKKICDLMHYIEFNNFSACDGYKLAKALKECRQERRVIKNKLEYTSIIKASSCKMIAQGKTLDSIRGLENKSYTPRVLKELFDKKKFN